MGEKRSGEPVLESIPAEHLAGDRYSLLNSPALALRAAAQDVVSVREDGRFSVVERGGFVCIWLYWAKSSGVEISGLVLVREIERLGGWLDGVDRRHATFTVPSPATFVSIETVLNDFAATVPGTQWYYGNVYGEDGVTPLNWWL